MSEAGVNASCLDHLTDAQRRAVLTADRSLLVSAAAGAGKTTVLAERCAALVCDVPPSQRCSVDELLVVTFTEAAATEMRSRIGRAIARRLEYRSGDRAYLQRQLYSLDNASISTIHAFCRALIQRWFPQAGVDPQPTVLAAEEAELLKHEVLDALFAELYGGADAFARAFQTLVDDYGDGKDARIAPLVLRIHAFVHSLPDPEAWLHKVQAIYETEQAGDRLELVHRLQYERLRRELHVQAEYAARQGRVIAACWPIAIYHIEAAEELAAQLTTWLRKLERGGPDAWESVAGEIRNFSFKRKRRPGKLSEQDKAAWEAAKRETDRLGHILQTRLRDAMCLFTAAEYTDGLMCVAPYVRTLIQLVRTFGERYHQAKRAQGAVDFDDLQRYAYRLLTENGCPDRPSEVARQLQRRYRYVLVDEFQDVDPLQAAILRCVSRESADPPEGNLFTVGDIKQSIYRFRLAEPALFAERTETFASGNGPGEVIHLPDNFRSRSEVIDAVNLVFRPLMRPTFGGTAYDETAELRAAAAYPDRAEGPAFGQPAIEMHLLEPVTATSSVRENGGTDDQNGDALDTEELEGIEREAFLIARRIRCWMGLDEPHKRWYVADRAASRDGAPRARPIAFRDIVILLRSLPFKAEPIAEILGRMGIPVRIENKATPLGSTECNDLMSLLRLLDNPLQDISLAAFLRSPLLRDPLSESDLLAVRLAYPDVPFHEAVARYTHEGADETLRTRLAEVQAFLDRYRHRIRERPVADVLWEICEETQYTAYVAGLPGGRQRYDRLVQLHELARQFGRFARQGLRRFLHFLDELLERGEAPPRSGVQGGEDDVVRIMTIHASKGLEFPVVVLADLGKKFNLEDTREPVLLDRRHGLGLDVTDPERRIRYPSLLRQVAAEHIRQESLSEELRVLYVALTRAREHLVLVGRTRPEKVYAAREAAGMHGPVPQLELEAASNSLAWLLAALAAAPRGVVDWLCEGSESTKSLVSVRVYHRDETDAWRAAMRVDPEHAKHLENLAELAPLPPSEPVADGDEVEPLIKALSYAYPATELTALPARIGVTELKRRWDSLADPLERGAFARGSVAPERPRFLQDVPSVAPAELGMATHRFLQLLDLARPCDAADLERQREHLLRQGRLSSSEAERILLDGVQWFFETPLGKRVRERANEIRREVAFVARACPTELDAFARPIDPEDFVLVRGMIDLVLPADDGLEIIDYKTDVVEKQHILQRAEHYRSQVGHYADCLQAISGKRVTRRWLVFLQARSIVELTDAGAHTRE